MVKIRELHLIRRVNSLSRSFDVFKDLVKFFDETVFDI